MNTENVHSIKHAHDDEPHVDATNYANPINCCCDTPERGHKTWVYEQNLKTNQNTSAAMTLMTHRSSRNLKEASQLLCDTMRCRVEYRDQAAEEWTESKRNALHPDRFWNIGVES
jgi:hypothetical protein